MKQLLVGSVFANDFLDQQDWLDLQLRSLAATTDEFDHVVVLSEGVTNDSFVERTKVLVPTNTMLQYGDAHLNGLNILLQEFRANADKYKNFLFLDADAFPIRKNWMRTLLSKMEPRLTFNQSGVAMPSGKGKTYEVAVALRAENLETRLHASILFVKGAGLQHVDFEMGPVGKDLITESECDIHLPTYQTSRRSLALPLLRSNKVNVHPLACGVYYDMFYHHSCGSGRGFHLRANSYLDHIVTSIDNVSLFTRQLMDDPNGFVRNLAGWNIPHYMTI